MTSRRPLLSTYLGVTVFLAAAAADGGTDPANPTSLEIDGSAQTASLSPSNPVAWFEVVGSPHDISHLDLVTTGGQDTTLALFRNLADALADDPLAQDDDSGQGSNALIRHFLGYPLPWLLKAELYDAQGSGDFEVAALSSSNPPEICSGSGPCTLVLAAKGRSGSADLLAILRAVRSFVLHSSPEGPELIDLYYNISRELIVDVATDSRLRQRLFEITSSLLPDLRQAVAVALGDPSDATVSREAVRTGWDLTKLVSDRVDENLARSLRAWMARLEAVQGTPIREAMTQLGLLRQSGSELTLPDGRVFPVKAREIIVKLRRSPTSSPLLSRGRVVTGLGEVDSVLAGYVVDEAKPLFGTGPEKRLIGLDRVLRLSVAPERVEELLRALDATSEVEYSERIGVSYLTSDDLYYSYQYGPEAVKAPAVWEIPALDSPLVAVIDSGVDWRQADLVDRTRTDLGWNFIDGTDDAMDDHGHGTHVAGTIAASVDNLYSVAGLCPSAQVVPYKVCTADGSCAEDNIAAAIVAAADAGVKIINMSLGGLENQTMEDAMEYASQQEVLIVSAAGNDGEMGSIFPASSSHSLSVGATDEQNLLAEWSNWGDLDLTAPGVDIVNLALNGVSCYNSGTSMATPHVSGVAALIAARKPDLNRTELTDRLLRGGVDLGEVGYDPLYGNGLVNALNSIYGLPVAYSFQMPVGGFKAEQGSALLTRQLWDSGYPKIRFNDDGDDTPDGNEWYVATAFNRDQWLSAGWSSGATEAYNGDSDPEADFHPGEDWNLTSGGASDLGKPVYSVADGVVVFKGCLYGNTVIVAHRTTTEELITSFYGHLKSPSPLALMEQVPRNGLIGEVGTSSGSTCAGSLPAHLHFELRRESLIERTTMSLPALATEWPDDYGIIRENYMNPSQFLELLDAPPTVEVKERDVAQSELVEACDTVILGPNLRVASPGGSLTVLARWRVQMEDGFSVDGEAGFSADTDDHMACLPLDATD